MSFPSLASTHFDTNSDNHNCNITADTDDKISTENNDLSMKNSSFLSESHSQGGEAESRGADQNNVGGYQTSGTRYEAGIVGRIKEQVPIPMPVAIHQSINTSSQLLFSFPIPQLNLSNTSVDVQPLEAFSVNSQMENDATENINHIDVDKDEEEDNRNNNGAKNMDDHKGVKSTLAFTKSDVQHILSKMSHVATSFMQHSQYNAIFTDFLREAQEEGALPSNHNHNRTMITDVDDEEEREETLTLRKASDEISLQFNEKLKALSRSHHIEPSNVPSSSLSNSPPKQSSQINAGNNSSKNHSPKQNGTTTTVGNYEGTSITSTTKLASSPDTRTTASSTIMNKTALLDTPPSLKYAASCSGSHRSTEGGVRSRRSTTEISWVPQDKPGMTLRPRRSIEETIKQEEGADEDENHSSTAQRRLSRVVPHEDTPSRLSVKKEKVQEDEEEKEIKKKTDIVKKEKRTRAKVEKEEEEGLGLSMEDHVEHYTGYTVRDIIETNNTTEPALQSLVGILSLEGNSVADIAPETLTHYLSSLLKFNGESSDGEENDDDDEDGNGHVHNKQSNGRKKNNATAADEIKHTESKLVEKQKMKQKSMRGLSCVTVMSNSGFPVSALPDGMVDGLISVFSTVVHCIGRFFTRVVREEMEGATTLTTSNTTRSKGRKKDASDAGKFGGVESKSDADISDAVVSRKELLFWMGQLRQYLRCFSIIICNRSLDIITDSDVFRLEDLCFKCLFVIPHRTSKAIATEYSAYVMDSVLFFYNCIWNRLEVQRHLTAEDFFSRLLISGSLAMRTYRFEDKHFMPLTLAILSAAQSTPIYADTLTDSNVERLRRQCTLWSSGIIHNFLLNPTRTERADVTLARTIVLQFIEDLTELLGVVEWPAADFFLRSCLNVLQCCLLPGNAAGGPHLSYSQQELVRSLAVDAFAEVALKLCDPNHGARYRGVETNVLKELEVLTENYPLDATVLQHWKKMTTDVGAALKDGKGAKGGSAKGKKNGAKSSKNETHVEDEEAEEDDSSDSNSSLSARQHVAALIYYNMSKKVERLPVAEAFTWYHTRAACVLMWREWSENSSDSLLPECAVDGLIRDVTTPCGSLPDVEPETLSRWFRALNASERKSALHPVMQQTLVSFLLSVFSNHNNNNGSNGESSNASDFILRKTLTHLSKLIAFFPKLNSYIWSITRSCVRGESAQVREHIVPLLLIILEGIVQLSTTTTAAELSSMVAYRPDSSDDLHRHLNPNGVIGKSGAAASSLLILSPVEENMVTDIISSLLHLLEDKSAAVVNRAIQALDTLLTADTFISLLATSHGDTLRGFAQHKLLALMVPEGKHVPKITKHFIHRWVVNVEQAEGTVDVASAVGNNDVRGGVMAENSHGGSVSSFLTSHPTVAAELQALTVLNCSEFPYEVEAEHPVVILLSAMNEMATAATATTGINSTKRRAKDAIDDFELHLVMKGVAKALWQRYQGSNSKRESIGSLAALHALAQANPTWIGTLTDVLLQSLREFQSNASSTTTTTTTNTTSTDTNISQTPHQSQEKAEKTAGAILQITRIIVSLLSGSSSPVVSLDQLSVCLTSLLSSYVGAYQQRIIVAACSALTAMITCGSPDKLSVTKVQLPYLHTCYSHMNSYYVRVKELLPNLHAQRQNVAYLQRYLFLLSEFLRLYHNWGKVTVLLQDDKITGRVPNKLAKDEGISGNVYSLLLEVLQVCGEELRERLSVITLRIFTSLCILEPATYWPLSEPYMKDALRLTASVTLQMQGLTFIRDFLKEEDSRVDLAAKLASNHHSKKGDVHLSNSKRKHVARNSSEEQEEQEEEEQEEDEDSNLWVRRSRGRRRKSETTTGKEKSKKTKKKKEDERDEDDERKQNHKKADMMLPSQFEDQNSGMATWVMQKFYAHVITLAENSPWSGVRRLALEIFRWSTQCGLFPPVKYVDVLVALSADTDAGIRATATDCLQELLDRYESAIAALASRGVVKAYHLHASCGAHLIQSAYLANPLGVEYSVYGSVYSMLHKKGRDNFMTFLTRLMHQEAKAVALWGKGSGGEKKSEVEEGGRGREKKEDRAMEKDLLAMYRTRDAATFLAHLAAAIVLTPFTHESDLLHILTLCSEGINLHGVNMVDLVQTEIDRVSALPSSSSTFETLNDASGFQRTTLHICLGVMLLQTIRQTLQMEYRLSAVRLQRLLSAPNGPQQHVNARSPNSQVIQNFLVYLNKMVKTVAPLTQSVFHHNDKNCSSSKRKSAYSTKEYMEALEFIKMEIETALMEDSGELAAASGGSLHQKSKSKSEGKPKRKRQESKSNKKKKNGGGKGKKDLWKRSRNSNSGSSSNEMSSGDYTEEDSDFDSNNSYESSADEYDSE